ncbi:MAG: hypothetical protein FJ267_15820 [Planctomycetes bacterium]|nr:hypothetical protein [Planctomycetota bacterium]
MNKPIYTFPNFSHHTILYKGRRFIAIAVSKEKPFEHFGDDEDFVVWDGLYGGVASRGTITNDGVYRGGLAFSHVEIDVDDASSIREFVKNTNKAEEFYFKGCGV